MSYTRDLLFLQKAHSLLLPSNFCHRHFKIFSAYSSVFQTEHPLAQLGLSICPKASEAVEEHSCVPALPGQPHYT